MTFYAIAVAIIAAAWALTEAWDALQRWADRRVAEDFRRAGVEYRPAMQHMDRRVEQALREGE